MNWDLVVGVMSLLTATIAFYVCVKVKEMVEIQKTMTLLALLSPASENQNAWALLIRHLVEGKRLRACDPINEEYLTELLERLGVKIDSNKNRPVEAIPTG